MYGPQTSAAPAESRGLTPRVLDHLFALMARDERKSNGSIKYHCTASMLEIYKERITDLLDGYEQTAGPAVGIHPMTAGPATNLKLREDSTVRDAHSPAANDSTHCASALRERPARAPCAPCSLGLPESPWRLDFIARSAVCMSRTSASRSCTARRTR